MNLLVKKYGIKYGLIIAAIANGYFLIAYLFDENLFVNFWIGITIMLAYFILLIMSVVSLKKAQEGFVSFKDAASVFTFTWIVNAAISIVFSILLFHVIDPELAGRVQEMTIEVQVSMLERFNSPQEVIDETVKKLQENDNYSIKNIFMGNAFTIIGALIMGLIVAAFFKKDKLVFENTVD